MTLAEQIHQDIISIEVDLDQPVLTYKGEEYLCIPSSPAVELTLEDGGFGEKVDMIFVIRKCLFTDGILPSNQEKVIYNSKTYRIISVTTNPTDTFLKLTCASSKRGV